MGDKPMLFDMYDYTQHTIKKQNPALTPDALKKLVNEKQAHAAGLIKNMLKEGKAWRCLITETRRFLPAVHG